MHVMWRMSCSIYYLNQIPKSFPKHIQVVLLPKLWPSNISQQTVTFIIILLLEWRILVYFHAYMKQSNSESTADGRITTNDKSYLSQSHLLHSLSVENFIFVFTAQLIPMTWKFWQVLALATVAEGGCNQISPSYTHKKPNLHSFLHTDAGLPWLISYLLAGTGWVLRSALCQ